MSTHPLLSTIEALEREVRSSATTSALPPPPGPHPLTPVRFAIELGRTHGDPAWEAIAADPWLTRHGLPPQDVEAAYRHYAGLAEGPGPWGGAWSLCGHTLLFRDAGPTSSLDASLTAFAVDLVLGTGHTTLLHLVWERLYVPELRLIDLFVDRALLSRRATSYADPDLADPLYRLLAFDNRLDRLLSHQVYALARHGAADDARWAEEAARHPDCFGQEAARVLARLLWRWHVADDEHGTRLRAPARPAPVPLEPAD